MKFTTMLSRNVSLRPQEVAVIEGDKALTYEQLGQRVRRLASGLESIGCDTNTCVGILALNSARYIEYLFAVPWAGCVLHPLNTRWSEDEVIYALDDSRTEVLFVDDQFLAMAPAIRSRSNATKTLVYCGDGECPEGFIGHDDLIEKGRSISDKCSSGDSLAAYYYTGGTSGAPKGVMLSHTNLVTSGAGWVVISGVPPMPRMLHAAPMFHMADMMGLMGTTLLGGSHVVLRSFSPDAYQLLVEQHSVTLGLLVPTMIQMLVDSPSFDPAKFASMTHLMYGASPMPSALLDRFRESLPDLGLIQGYGMTEAGPLISISPVENHTEASQASGRIKSAGLPSVFADVRIFDASDHELPEGEVGEIVVRAPNVMLGYKGQEEKTRETLRDGWLHTGDAGYLDSEGFLYIVDRVKDMVITGGENVFSAEVESVLSKHPEVSQCAVIGIPSEEWGESVHAVLVPKGDCRPSVEELGEFCKAAIAGYKAPKSIEYVDQLPVSAAGKVLKAKLREPFWKGRDSGVS